MRKTISLILLFSIFLTASNLLAQDQDQAPPQLPPVSRQFELANEALDEALGKGHLVASWIESMLVKKDYKRIEEAYENLQVQYDQDVAYETYLLTAYEIFHPGSQNITIEALDAWVDKTDSYVAYAARGMYRAFQGAAKRGNKAAVYVSEDDFASMRDYFQVAAKDLLKAVDKNPKLTPAYMWLVIMAKLTKMPYDGYEIVQRAWEHDPRTYYVPANYLGSLLPRWGGTYIHMAAFVIEAMQYAHLNPRLYTLQGHIEADMAAYEYRAGNFNYSAELYSSAMRFGERVSWLRFRAACYYKLDKYKEALDDFTRVLVYEPHNKQANEWIPWLAANLK